MEIITIENRRESSETNYSLLASFCCSVKCDVGCGVISENGQPEQAIWNGREPRSKGVVRQALSVHGW